ncbi:hypothetical protein EON65_27905 [archaeon]|nr:MAG: hypothetical protein EON65_27905 [archaeon]
MGEAYTWAESEASRAYRARRRCSHDFHDFILLDGTVDARDYVTVLQQYLLPVIEKYFPGRPCIFQQDNSCTHGTVASSPLGNDELPTRNECSPKQLQGAVSRSPGQPFRFW